jgi:hypothetical protein
MAGDRPETGAEAGTVGDSRLGFRTLTARSVDSLANRPADAALAVVALLVGVLVFVVAHELFPYHSLNHDEGVYLQQAAMLLEGKLTLTPPVPEAVRPWFFVSEDGRMYSKYTPVAALLFAPGLALGVPRVGLAVVAAASVALVGLLGREAFDDRVGVVAAALVATAPLFVFTSAVFLSYAPTTALNLLFALAYVRTLRRESLRYAGLAGVAVGLAFFSRPFTAVLFAAPFIAHAVVTLGRVWWPRLADRSARSAGTGPDSRAPWSITRRLLTVAALGTAFVCVTLGYNWVVTGDPLVFPYQAFAPEDGPGFGHREILNHERDYTPALAVEANRRVLAQLFTRWGPLGWLGSTLALVGLLAGFAGPVRRVVAARIGSRSAGAEQPTSPDSESGGEPATDPRFLGDRTCRALLAALFVTVSTGNVWFWGNLNVLADVSDPTDGLIANLGPFYHFDLLLPLSVFGAAGVVALWGVTRALVDRGLTALGQATGTATGTGPLSRLDRGAVRNVALAVVLVGSLAGAGSVGAATFDEPLERNAEYRDDLATVYEPFERTDLENALVLVPTPYGPWLNHPFQWLRNDPSFDGDVVYVMDRGADGDAATLAAFPDRKPYRFRYRGSWPPAGEIEPVVEPLTVERGERLRVDARVGVVTGAQGASVRVEAGGETLHYGLDRVDGETETVTWTLTEDRVGIDAEGLRRYSDASSISVDGPTTVTLTVTFVQPGGSTITYLQETTVVDATGDVGVFWPPEERVCRLTADCDRTYVPGGDYAAGVSMASNVTAGSQDSE